MSDFQLEDTTMNTGVIDEVRITDWVMGGASGITPVVVNPSGQWGDYLPTEESQVGLYFDSYGCVSFSALNCIETQLNYLLENKKLSTATVCAMEDSGYIYAGKFNFSDRFLAKVSDTTREGNSGVKVWDAIRKFGLVPETEWSFPYRQSAPVYIWEDYYAPIPQSLINKGKTFLDYFDVAYEWVAINPYETPTAEIKEALKQAPLQIFSPTCSPWNTDKLILNCGIRKSSHATTIYGYEDGEQFFDFDHYSPYEKKLAWDYPILYVLKGVVTEKPAKPPNLELMEFLRKNEGKLIQMTEPGDIDSGKIGLLVNGELLVTSPERAGLLALTQLIRDGKGLGVAKDIWSLLTKKDF